MAILDFVKPDKVVMLDSNDFSGSFEFRPLEPGFGITIGNALRRIYFLRSKVLLSLQSKLKVWTMNFQLSKVL